MRDMDDTLSGLRWPCPVCGAADGVMALRFLAPSQLPYFCLVCCWAYTEHLSPDETRRRQGRWPQ